MKTYLLDTNAIDWIGDVAGAADHLQSLVEAEMIDILFTHVAVDELARIPDEELRVRRLLTLVSIGRIVPTAGVILDFSRLDHGGLDEDVDSLDVLRSGNPDHSFDALAANTARRLGAQLVSRDRQLTQLCRRDDVRVDVATPEAFLKNLGANMST